MARKVVPFLTPQKREAESYVRVPDCSLLSQCACHARRRPALQNGVIKWELFLPSSVLKLDSPGMILPHLDHTPCASRVEEAQEEPRNPPQPFGRLWAMLMNREWGKPGRGSWQWSPTPTMREGLGTS